MKPIKDLQAEVAGKHERIKELEVTVGALVAFNRRAISK